MNLFKNITYDIEIRRFWITGSIYIFLKAWVHYIIDTIPNVRSLSEFLPIVPPTNAVLSSIYRLNFRIIYFILPVIALILFKQGVTLIYLLLKYLSSMGDSK